MRHSALFMLRRRKSQAGRSVFDERLEPGQRLIPLPRDACEVTLHLFNRPRVKREPILAAD